ncbi:MAG: thioesterase family protein [Bdellovibrionales bacterium]|nr:thioesterase family protein [Bdellovibrionales bacterium]
MAFRSQFRVHFEEADPAGIAFFGVVYNKVHHAYEDFLASMGIDLTAWFLNPEVITPIRGLTTNFTRPLLPLETYDIQVVVPSISEHSFQLRFTIEQEGQEHCQVTTTHVCVEKSKMKKITIPETLRLQLEKHRERSPDPR